MIPGVRLFCVFVHSVLMPDNRIFIAGAVIGAVVKGILDEMPHFILVQILFTDRIAKFLVIGKIHAVITFRHEAIRLLFSGRINDK